MQKVYRCSKKVYILFFGGFFFLLFATITALKKGDVLWSIICGASALVVFAFASILHKQIIVVSDEGIETRAVITRKLSFIRRVPWADITKIEEDHFWDILTLLYIFVYDRKKGLEKLGLSLNMITNYKNHEDLVREILDRIPRTTRIIGDVKKYCEYRPKFTLRRLLLWFFLFAAIFQLTPAGIAFLQYGIVQWHSFVLGAIFLIIAFVLLKKGKNNR